MNEIKQRAKRAKHWRGFLDQVDVKARWHWCLYVGLCETAVWARDDSNLSMFDWSK